MKKKKILIVFIIITVLTLLIGGRIWWWKKENAPNSSSEKLNTKKPTESSQKDLAQKIKTDLKERIDWIKNSKSKPGPLAPSPIDGIGLYKIVKPKNQFIIKLLEN